MHGHNSDRSLAKSADSPFDSSRHPVRRATSFRADAGLPGASRRISSIKTTFPQRHSSLSDGSGDIRDLERSQASCTTTLFTRVKVLSLQHLHLWVLMQCMTTRSGPHTCREQPPVSTAAHCTCFTTTRYGRSVVAPQPPRRAYFGCRCQWRHY